MDPSEHWNVADLADVLRILNDASPSDQFSGLQLQENVFEDPDITPAFAEFLETQWGRNWLIESLRALRRDPVSGHLALRHGEILGFAVHDVSGPGQFGPMGVRADLRKCGVGGVLLKRCLADLREAGYPIADIQWVGPIDFYARQVSATLTRCFWQMEKSLGSDAAQ